MSAPTLGTISVVAAVFVLFTALLEPRVSAALAVIALLALAIYQFAFVANTGRHDDEQ
jgi:hypothetical protein